ncbi:MAG: PAS domain S-box protein [Bacteroidales bacterium]|jgi:hypothetical protein
MEYTIDQIIDIDFLQSLQDKLNAINPFPSALIDLNGKVLTATDWQEICVNFHRIHPESNAECIKSDQYILSHLDEADPAVTYKCPHGMVDNAIPIIVEGHHLANFFTGQFFLEPPDMDFFKRQAEQFGFDEGYYLEAVRKVPVWTHEKLKYYLDFIKAFTESMAVTGLARLREIESSRLAKESENLYQTVVEQASDGIFISDQYGRYVDVNQRGCEMLGYTKEEILKLRISDLVTAEDLLANPPRFEELTKGAVILTQRKLKRKNGSVIQVEINAKALANGYFLGMHRDITNRISALNEIQENEVKYRQLAELTPVGLLIHVAGVIQYANNSAARIFGASAPEDLIGRKVMEFVHPDYQKIVADRIGKISNKGDEAPLIEEKLIRLSGETFYSEVSAIPFTLGGQKAVQVVFNDISKRKAAEEKVRTLALAIDCINESVSMTDTGNTIIFVNKAFCNTYGYTQDELMGHNISMVRPPEDPNVSTISEILTETIGGGWSGELLNRRKDGTDFLVHISTAIVTDENDLPVALIGIAVDVTESKKNEAELIAAKEKAEESDRLKSAFLANISHEIRTPMNSVLGFSELLSDMVDDPKQQEYLNIISTAGERLLNIINSVIDIAKIEAGQVNLEMTKVDVKLLMNDLLELNKHRNPRITFVNDAFQQESVMLVTDKTKLFQILNNLINNALKFTRKGSVHFGYTRYPDSLVFYVKDTGLGIPPESRSKVFERFHKVDLHDRNEIEGTGLGLAITKELVGLLNGTIWFESEPGRGTTFFVSFPG